MYESQILIIDDTKFYWDTDNECLIPYELFNNNINQKNINFMNNNKDINKHINEDINEDTDNQEWYMDNYDISFWEKILSRQLDNEEKILFYRVWNENLLNVDIKMLQKQIIKNNCYIKGITNNIGNCLFESLASFGLGDNDLNIKPSEMIRKNVACILLLIKKEKGFFPNLKHNTPEEIFLNQNDIEFVKDKNTKLVYEYDYDMMIYDLSSIYSWTRLPTEFILMAISRIYQVEILIYHNNSDFINKINSCDKINNFNDIDKIRLGQINEEHYFPLLELPDELKYNNDVLDEIINTHIKYDHDTKKFKKWSKIMIESLNNYNTHNFDSTDNNINNNNDNLDESVIMKSNNKLTEEQINDYMQIANFDEFENI